MMKRNLKETILKIPVIGQLAAVALLPREMEKQKQFHRDTAAAFESLGQQIRDRTEIAEDRWNATTGTFDSLGQQIRDLDGRTKELREELSEEKDQARFDQHFQHLLDDGPALSALRSGLSIHPAVWGPADRLRIDPEANVDSCLFNTNSGCITVGKYSFAGPGVSLIAGNHDMRLADFPRRDLQQPEGCDIVIGKGVWLCANCTVLGPCRIGDHAVIAAGAVVIPGTDIEAGCLYAGVPARKIREIEMLSGEENVPEEVFSRFGGCLYTKGWYTAESIRDEAEEQAGHWMIREEAEILCKSGERTLRYLSPMREKENRKLRVSAGGWSEEITPGASGEIRIPEEAFGEKGTGLLTLRISELYAPENGDPRKLGLFII